MHRQTFITACLLLATISQAGNAQVVSRATGVFRATRVHDYRTKTKNRFPTKIKVPPRGPSKTHGHNTNISFAEASEVMAPYRQWMIGANSSGYLYPKNAWNGPASKSYNLKGSVPRKFLQYEKQGFAGGINIGWTSNASAETATRRAKWFFTRNSNNTGAIRYGEPLALAWGNTKNSYVKYGHRTIGINLDWTSKPSYEWAILGGQPGHPVRKGKDLVIIYNMKHKQPLMYFNRTVGGDIGWPDSRTWKQQAWTKLKKQVTIENVVIVLGLIAGQMNDGG